MKEKVVHPKIKEHFRSKRKLSSSFSVFISAILIAILLLFVAAFCANGIFIPKEVNRLSYSEKSALNYEVCLKPNAFFENECLSTDRQYIASLIKNINIDFNYMFSASNKFNYTYKYYIDAELVANEKVKSKKVIYSKTERLLAEKTITNKDSNYYNIKEKIVIDYNKYNEIMKEFKQEYAILFDSKLIVSMTVETIGKYSLIKDDIKSKQVMKMEIPLSEQTIDIAFNRSNVKNDDVIEEINQSTPNRIILITILTLVSLVEIVLVAGLVILIRKKIYHRNAYNIEVNRILKEYDRFITTVDNLPHLGEKEVLSVGHFQELLDTRECLNKPILYFEIKKNKKGCFLIISDDMVYIYSIEK